MTRRAHIHVFASVKGGVGKSTMALLSAHLLDRMGCEVVLMDLDCLGTSLTDVASLSLTAPKLQARKDNPEVLDLGVDPVGYLTWPEAMLARQRRSLRGTHDQGGAAELPFLNDAIFLADEFWPPKVDTLLWQWPGHPNTRVIGSSSLFPDINNMSLWLGSGLARKWTRRVWQLTMALIEQRPNLTHIVWDLPPGLHGYSLEAFEGVGLMADGLDLDLGEGEYPSDEALLPDVEFRAFRNVVVTPDPQDMAMGVDALRLLRPLRPDVELILNRAVDSLDDAWMRVESVIGPLVAGLGIKQAIRRLSQDVSLGRIFQGIDLDAVEPEVTEQAVRILRLSAVDGQNGGVA